MGRSTAVHDGWLSTQWELCKVTGLCTTLGLVPFLGVATAATWQPHIREHKSIAILAQLPCCFPSAQSSLLPLSSTSLTALEGLASPEYASFRLRFPGQPSLFIPFPPMFSRPSQFFFAILVFLFVFSFLVFLASRFSLVFPHYSLVFLLFLLCFPMALLLLAPVAAALVLALSPLLLLLFWPHIVRLLSVLPLCQRFLLQR